MEDFSMYRPVSKAEREHAAWLAQAPAGAVAPAAAPPVALAPVSGAAAPTQAVLAPVPPALAPAPRFVGGKLRSRVIPLDYHLEHEGRVYTAITVRRPTSAEVGRFFERMVELAAIDPAAELRFPVFVDEAGAPIPEAVLNALDGDDDERVNEAANDFLPGRLRRFRAALQPALLPNAGDNTEPTSSM